MMLLARSTSVPTLPASLMSWPDDVFRDCCWLNFRLCCSLPSTTLTFLRPSNTTFQPKPRYCFAICRMEVCLLCTCEENLLFIDFAYHSFFTHFLSLVANTWTINVPSSLCPPLTCRSLFSSSSLTSVTVTPPFPLSSREGADAMELLVFRKEIFRRIRLRLILETSSEQKDMRINEKASQRGPAYRH